jgi:hypothetical protein
MGTGQETLDTASMADFYESLDGLFYKKGKRHKNRGVPKHT